MKISNELKHELTAYKARGGYKSRKQTVARVYQFLSWCGEHYGVKAPDNIGRKHVYQWLNESKSDSTRRDRYYAVRLLWIKLGRNEPTFAKH